MGLLNLIKGSWDGKVGEFVGAKWKNKKTLRVYSTPSNPNTAAQQTVRTGFKELSSFVALFADGIKSLTALNVRSMSVRNAIIALNKDMVTDGALTVGDLQISRGGLPSPVTFAATSTADNGTLACTWTAVTGSTITAKAKIVVVAVDKTNNIGYVGSAPNADGTFNLPVSNPSGTHFDVYAYLLDYRGSTKVASVSIYDSVDVA